MVPLWGESSSWSGWQFDNSNAVNDVDVPSLLVHAPVMLAAQ
jgi:hypothetical protein